MKPQSEDVELLFEQVDNYRRDHPEIDEAIRTLEISEDVYRASLAALLGEQTVVTSSANELPRA